MIDQYGGTPARPASNTNLNEQVPQFFLSAEIAWGGCELCELWDEDQMAIKLRLFCWLLAGASCFFYLSFPLSLWQLL